MIICVLEDEIGRLDHSRIRLCDDSGREVLLHVAAGHDELREKLPIQYPGAQIIFEPLSPAAQKLKDIQERLAWHPGDPPIVKGSDKRSWYNQMQRSEFKEWYKEYLGCGAWGARRQKVLERANFVCEGCRDAKATQVHHLTYDHVGDELLFELVAVCDDCHDKAHGR